MKSTYNSMFDEDLNNATITLDLKCHLGHLSKVNHKSFIKQQCQVLNP
jgi:hypothetical protein